MLTRDKNETLVYTLVMLLSIASPNIIRFQKFFHHQTQEEICNNVVIKDSTTPQMRRYITF